MADADDLQAPARLRVLASWQANKVSVLGARIYAHRVRLGTRADFAVLAALEEYGPLSQVGIGRRLGLDRNDVNAILNRLEAAGHVSRGPDPSDRRRNVVDTTPAGLRQLEELQRHTDAVQDELLVGLDPDERRRLDALLTKLLDGHPPQPA